MEDKKNPNTEQPKKKKWWIFAIIAVVIIGAICSGNGSSVKTDDTKTSESPKSDIKQELKDKYELDGGYKAKGNVEWYIDSISNADAVDPLLWAEDYYNTYGKPGSVLYVLNFANHTTTMLRNDSSDGLMLNVEVMDGIDEKSLSQGHAYGGAVLKSYYLYYDDNGKLVTEEID
jgi:hypothetical protein